MQPTGYLSAEIGFSSDVPTYSGGLGVLAGDHLKAAADAGLPMAGVTLLYREGYFVQHLSPTGDQGASYPRFNPEPLLTRLEERVTVRLCGRDVQLAIWCTQLIGHGGRRVPIFFLDSDVPENHEEDRSLTYRLYGGDNGLRIRQEAILGFGGVSTLAKYHPEIRHFHLNEGHCAFAPLALLADGVPLETVRASCHFTTHTPVPAGHDIFAYDLARGVLGPLIENLPVPIEQLAGADSLSMSHLALNTCGTANGVSKLHGEVSRDLFPDHDIGYVTNGVHHLTWVSPHMANVYDEYLAGWRGEPDILAQAVTRIPDGPFLAAHKRRKQELLTFANANSQRGFAADLLTIGFARRAAPYKRATLLFKDPERLTRICGGRVQLVFAGKAHPADHNGQSVIREVIGSAAAIGTQVRICYLENYSIWMGSLITSGVDVWLNTPRRPREASGTSGMKAALNGVPNCSTSDGWWAEGARDGENGWVIGDPSVTDDEADAEALYQTLEKRLLPAWEDRRLWASIMKAAVATGAEFTTHRMLRDYITGYYEPAQQAASKPARPTLYPRTRRVTSNRR